MHTTSGVPSVSNGNTSLGRCRRSTCSCVTCWTGPGCWEGGTGRVSLPGGGICSRRMAAMTVLSFGPCAVVTTKASQNEVVIYGNFGKRNLYIKALPG